MYNTSSEVADLRVYTLLEAARILAISTATLRRLIRSGEIDAPKIGGQRRVTEAELRRALHLDRD